MFSNAHPWPVGKWLILLGSGLGGGVGLRGLAVGVSVGVRRRSKGSRLGSEVGGGVRQQGWAVGLGGEVEPGLGGGVRGWG